MIANDRKDKDGSAVALSKADKLSNAKEMLEKGTITQAHYDTIAENLAKHK